MTALQEVTKVGIRHCTSCVGKHIGLTWPKMLTNTVESATFVNGPNLYCTQTSTFDQHSSWQTMADGIAVDILEVPVSSKNNRYILVVQDYFTKWADARPIPDQTAVRITRELVHIFAGYGIPEIIHSDQGRNFESTIFQQTMAAFGVKKTRTTAYHPQGDGMVERFNRTVLQLLRAYVDQQNEWEKYLPLALYAYRTSTHTSTSVSPFELMFGRQPKDHTEGQTGYAVDEYQGTMQAKLAELMDFVETHMVDAASHQKQENDKHMGIRTFKAGDLA